MNTKNLLVGAIIAPWMMLAAGCGGSSSSGDEAPTQPPAPSVNHAVGGSVFGLHGTLVLQNNGSDGVTLTADGTFAFANTLAVGATYSVSVQTPPVDQVCTVSNGGGTIADADVTNVTVNCSTITRIVGGAVSGLASSESVVLQNNAGDNLTIDSDGDFSFATPVAQSGAYNVTVLAQPATQTCSVTHGSGTAGISDIDDVQVTCSINAYTVGGTVSGLTGSVTLQNNGVDDLTLSSDGVFAFSAPVAQGANYDVTISTQPPAQTCVVTNGSGAMGGANVANIGLSCTWNVTTLSASVSELALSVTGLTEYGVGVTPPSSGEARRITIANTGSNIAMNLSVDAPSWPFGTMSSTTCSSTLAAGATCEITVTPGPIASSDGTDSCSTGTAPLPGTIEVSGDNTNTVTSTVVVLNYGCIYQGGYVYAFDDTAPPTQSVRGKVAATANQATAATPSNVMWSANASASFDFTPIYGISESSTVSTPDPVAGLLPGQNSCEGAIDGACNTNNIYIHHQNNAVAVTYYAAGLCTQTISGYSDWYLPAMCELGYDAACGNQSTPRLQNMQSNLVEFNGLNLLSDLFWSSTISEGNPSISAWLHFFSASGSFQSNAPKNNTLGVRCSRVF